MSRGRPPRLARWVATKLDSGSAEGLLGDLEEQFHEHAERVGNPEPARIEYCYEVACSLPPILLMRSRAFLASQALPSLVGSFSSVCWFIAAYFMIATLSGHGGRPLGDLRPLAFLGVWVFGSGVVGGFAAGRVRPSAAGSARLVVGLFAACLVLLAIDAPTALFGEIAVGLASISGAVFGAALGARRVAFLRVAEEAP